MSETVLVRVCHALVSIELVGDAICLRILGRL